MKISPVDIRQQQFGVKFRGFDSAEVDTFLEMVAGEMEALVQERDSLKEQLDRREAELTEYKDRERDLQKSLSAVQKVRESLTEGATREAQLIVEEAKQRAADLVGKAEDQLGGLRAEVTRLRGLKKTFEIRLRSLLDTFQKMLELDEGEALEEPAGAGPMTVQEPEAPEPEASEPEAPGPASRMEISEDEEASRARWTDD